jgi:putative transcriptional regulator
MIYATMKVRLSRLMGDKRVKIAEVARDTGIDRGTLTRLYYEKAERIDLDMIARLCVYFGRPLTDLLEVTPGEAPANPADVQAAAPEEAEKP